MKKLLLTSTIFILLTILTQIGGLVYLVYLLAIAFLGTENKWLKTSIGLTLYLVATFVLVPVLAPLLGRERVVHTQIIRPTSYMTVLLNRNYVRPELNELLLRTEKRLSALYPNMHISYLDANFPFIDKFPLLPHLSHSDGKKLDLSFVYQHMDGSLSNDKKSRSGYGVFVEPRADERHQTKICKDAGYFQYDYTAYASFGAINKELVFSEKGTKALIKTLLADKSLGKLFIEPHLKSRLHLNDNRVRFHGCRAVRHDDHIHIQL